MAEHERGNAAPKRRSLWWYAPIVLLVSAGYGLGGAFSFGTAFLGWFPRLVDPAGRWSLQLFGMGMLGASLYCSRWWSLDYDEALEDESVRPTSLDWFGYATTIAGGGVTGVLLPLIVRYGVSLVTQASGVVIQPGAALVLALTGGLFHFKVQALLEDLFRSIQEKATASAAGDGEPNPTDPSRESRHERRIRTPHADTSAAAAASASPGPSASPAAAEASGAPAGGQAASGA